VGIEIGIDKMNDNSDEDNKMITNKIKDPLQEKIHEEGALNKKRPTPVGASSPQGSPKD